MAGLTCTQTWYLVLVSFLCFTFPHLSSAGPIQPGSSLLADPNLQQCLDKALIENGWTTTEEVISLECPGREVELLFGIENLPNLQTLRLPNNRIDDAAPLDLLLQLQVLDLSDNRLTDLFLLDLLFNLKELYITGNRALTLAEVHPVMAGNPGLTHLGLGGIAIGDLSQLPIFSGPTGPYALVELDVSDTGLDGLFPLDQLSALQVLKAASNRLIDVAPLGQMQQLRALDLSHNQLVDIAPLQGLENLVEFSVTGNPALTLAMVQPVIANNPGLMQLGVGGIPIGDLSRLPIFSGPTGPYALVGLDVSDTGLDSLWPLNQIPGLEILRAAHNRLIDTVPLDQLSQLRALDLSHNQLQDAIQLQPLQNLQELYLTGNSELTQAMVQPVMVNNPGLTHLGLGGIAIDTLSQLPIFTGSTGPYALVELDVSNTGLDDLWPLNQVSTLQVLRAADNQLIDTAPLNMMLQLRVLDLSDNQLPDLAPLQSLQDLRQLDVTGNPALTLAMVQPVIANNPELTHLGVGGIAIGDLSQLPIFSGPTGPCALVELDVSDTGLDSLWPLNQIPGLEILRAAHNRLIDTVPLDQLSQLRALDLSHNQLQDAIQLQPLQNLQELYLTGNSELTQAMVQPVIANNPGLTHLGLGGIAIGDLSQLPIFSGTTGPYSLIELDVSDTGLVDLWLLAQLPTLQVLLAANNQLIDATPLDQLPLLRALDLSHNQLVDVAPLPTLENLQELTLTGNPALTLTMVQAVIAANPGLTHLGVGGIPIGDLSLLPVFAGPTGPYSLVELDVSDTGVNDLSPLSPLLPALEVLRVADNQVIDASPLGQSVRLRVIDLSDNQIELVHLLAGIPYLEFLDLRGNTGIQCDELDVLETEFGAGILQRPLICVILTSPEVLILEPLGPEVFYQTTTISFLADASDVEDGDLASHVQWTSSRDGFIGAGSPLNQSLSSGEHVITATVTDSHGNSSAAFLTIQVLPNTAPTLTPWTPLNGAVINSGGLAILGANASDAEEGDIGWKVQWSSSLDGYLGSGPYLQVQLGMASHIITATVTDAAGASVSQAVSIIIGPFEDTDEDSLSDYEETCFDGNCNDYDPYHPINNPEGMDTDILSSDSDQDGYSDMTEVSLGSDPLDSASTPGIVADGDINLDGQVNAADVLLAQRYLLGLASLSQEQIEHGDYRPLPGGDGELGTDDLLLITRATLIPD